MQLLCTGFTALIYRSGKVLLLGLNDPSHAQTFYHHFTQFIPSNGYTFIAEVPKSDVFIS